MEAVVEPCIQERLLAIIDGAPRNVSKPGWVSASYIIRTAGGGHRHGSPENIALAALCMSRVLSWQGGYMSELADGTPYAAATYYHRNTPLEILAMQAPKGPKKPTHKAARRTALENAVLDALAYYTTPRGRLDVGFPLAREPLQEPPTDFIRRALIDAYVKRTLSEPYKRMPKEQSLEARLNRTISELKQLGIIEERAVRLGSIALGVPTAFEFYYRKRSTLEMLASQAAS